MLSVEEDGMVVTLPQREIFAEEMKRISFSYKHFDSEVRKPSLAASVGDVYKYSTVW